MHQRPNKIHPENLLYLRIESGSGPDTKVLAAVLNALNLSFHSFILAELYHQNSEVKTALKKEINFFAAECSLLLYDIKLSDQNLAFAVGPDALSGQYRLLQNAANLKLGLFVLFVDTVFSTSIFSPESIKKTAARYTAKQRIDIFKAFADLTDQWRQLLYFGRQANTVNLLWQPPNDPDLRSSLIPEAVKLPKEPVETYYQYVKTGEENDLFGKRSRYEKVLVKEAAKHDLYPYQLQKITVKGKKFTFAKTLSASVSVKNNLYEISLPELSINTKHETRAGSEKAFDAAVAVLILQLEKDDQQAKNANLIKLKSILNEY